MADIKTLNTIDTSPFKRLVLNLGAVPSAFTEGMTYYEVLAWLCNFIEKEVVPKTNEAIVKFNVLKDYVEHYFDNLDVQEEINNKLDAMAEDGTLEEIIAAYLQLSSVLAYNSVSELRSATNLVDGNLVETFGFYERGDGGGAKYYVREITNSDTVDNVTTLALNDNSLVAILIIPTKEINVKQFGCKCDGTTDDTLALQHAIDIAKARGLSVLISGFCRVTDSINTKGVKIRGDGDKLAMMTNQYISGTYGNIGWDYLRNVDNGALITFDDFVSDYLTVGSGICSSNASPILYCNHSDGKFRLQDIAIAGWIRTEDQIGIKSTYTNVATGTYVNGGHDFNNVNVFNCGGNGIELDSLELRTITKLRSMFNFGKGLYINENSNYDMPFEYCTFVDCNFSYNKSYGVHAHNSFRKDVKFEHCNVNAAGLYKQLNLSYPESTEDIISGFFIDGKSQYNNVNPFNLIFDRCYGEETDLMFYIKTNYTNKYTFSNNIQYPSSQKAINCMIYLDGIQTRNLSIFDNYTNFTSESNAKAFKVTDTVTYIAPLTVDNYFYDNYDMGKTITLNTKLTSVLTSVQRYNNVVDVTIVATANADIAAYENLFTGFPKPIMNNSQIVIENGDSKVGNVALYTNNQATYRDAITNGTRIVIKGTYFTRFISGRDGTE